MLYEAIRLGCKKFHEGDFGAKHYDDALDKRSKWINPDIPSLEEAKRLKLFANRWNSHTGGWKLRITKSGMCSMKSFRH